jgi:PLP dependent protein
MTASFDPRQASNMLLAVRSRVDAAATAAGRSGADVALLAVSKLQAAEKIEALYAAGQRAFGENYVQEGVDKIARFATAPRFSDIEWHLIGPLQSNKTRVVAEHFQWVHSVDRLKIAERLSAQRPLHLPPLNLCIQVNISGEASKSGCPPDEALALIAAAGRLPNVTVRGLMGMPEPGIGDAATREQFLMLAAVFTEAKLCIASIDTLSIGMSDDLDIAVACGSTMVRVGTALFGARPAAKI